MDVDRELLGDVEQPVQQHVAKLGIVDVGRRQHDLAQLQLGGDLLGRERGVGQAQLVQGLRQGQGMTKKFEAMGSMSDQQRSHEEFRMRLDKQHEEQMESIRTNVEIAKQQAFTQMNSIEVPLNYQLKTSIWHSSSQTAATAPDYPYFLVGTSAILILAK